MEEYVSLCAGVKKNGRVCDKSPQYGSSFCWWHSGECSCLFVEKDGSQCKGYPKDENSEYCVLHIPGDNIDMWIRLIYKEFPDVELDSLPQLPSKELYTYIKAYQVKIETKELINDYCLTIEDLLEHRDDDYETFINVMIEKHNEIVERKKNLLDTMKIAYPKTKIKIRVPLLDPEDEDATKLIELENPNGFSEGELLYQLAKNIVVGEYYDNHFFEGLKIY